MVDVEKLHKAVVSEAYSLSYFGPTSGHLKECPGFGDGWRRLYVIDDSYDDGDCGYFEIDFHEFPTVRYDWNSGMWKCNDEEMLVALDDPVVQIALRGVFGEIMKELGPNGIGGDEAKRVWRLIVSLCLTDTAKLMNEIEVLTIYEADAKYRIDPKSLKNCEWSGGSGRLSSMPGRIV